MLTECNIIFCLFLRVAPTQIGGTFIYILLFSFLLPIGKRSYDVFAYIFVVRKAKQREYADTVRQELSNCKLVEMSMGRLRSKKPSSKTKKFSSGSSHDEIRRI